MAKIRLRRGVATLAVAVALALFIAPRLLISNVESSIGGHSGAVDLAGLALSGELARETSDAGVLSYEQTTPVFLMNASTGSRARSDDSRPVR